MLENFLRGRSFGLRLLQRIAYAYVRFDVTMARLRYGLNNRPRKEKIIVSMTTYPARFDSVVLSLKSLLLQSVKPDKIIVWLGSDTSPADITDKMHILEKYGVEYRFDNIYNLKPHKKYYYALQEFKQDLVITVDDDILYPRTMIFSLIKQHKKFPGTVCARRVHKVCCDSSGKIMPYSKWVSGYRGNTAPDSKIFATNGAGTLFPPDALSPRAFDVNAINKLCLNADDVWIWFMERLNGTLVVWTPCILTMPPVVESTKCIPSLADSNVQQNANDEYIKNMVDEYGNPLIYNM